MNTDFLSQADEPLMGDVLPGQGEFTDLIMGMGRRNRSAIGTSARDILDSTDGQSNQVFGRNGRDRLLAGKDDQLYGGRGRDVLDAREGKGRNQLFGEKGIDRLFGHRKDELFGNRDNDFLSSRNGRGRNSLRGGQGNDDLIAGTRDRLYGGVGADVLDASASRGRNQLFAGRGNDFLYGGVDDVLVGGKGHDTLLAGNGRNFLFGGRGRDQFWIADGELPETLNIVADFNLTQDTVVIGRIDGVNTFADVTLTQDGDNTIVTIQGEDIAVLNDVAATQLTEDHFIFASSFVSGDEGETISVTVTLESRAAKFGNQMGYFLVDDAQGRIGALLPGDEGYAKVALERSQVLFQPKAKAGAVATLEVPANSHLGWYLVQDSTAKQVLRRNPDNTVQNNKIKNDQPLAFFSFPEANPDGDRHIAYRSSTELGWEDLTNGGDRSFDDLVFSVGPETVVAGIQIPEPEPPTPEPEPPAPAPPSPELEGATLQGFKWNDLNGDGLRNVLIQGTPSDIIFVIDVSPSVAGRFPGTLPGDGDINGDGRSNTRFDAELAGFIALNQQLIAQGIDDAKIGIVTFGRSAIQEDMNPLTAELDLVTTTTSDTDNNGIPDVEDVLRSLNATRSGTNFEAGLQVAQDTFAGVGTAPGNGNLIFMSDGGHNGFGAYDDEVAELEATGMKLSAFGVGAGSVLETLSVIDEQARIFNTTDELIEFFGGVAGRTGLQEPGLAGVTVYLDLNNNFQLDDGEPTQVTADDDPTTDDIDETGLYSFTDVAPGTYTVREVVPAGFRQTAPSGDPLVDNDGFADRVLDSTESSVTLGFDERVINGPGEDIFIQDLVFDDAGTITIEVSTNGVDFELLAIVFEDADNLIPIDLAEIDFSGTVTNLRISGLDLSDPSSDFALTNVSVSTTSIDYSGSYTVTVAEAEVVGNLNFGNTRRL